MRNQYQVPRVGTTGMGSCHSRLRRGPTRSITRSTTRHCLGKGSLG